MKTYLYLMSTTRSKMNARLRNVLNHNNLYGSDYNVVAVNVEEGGSLISALSDKIWEIKVDVFHNSNIEWEADCDCSESTCVCGAYELAIDECCEVDVMEYDPNNKEHIICPGCEDLRDVSQRNTLLNSRKMKELERKLENINRKLQVDSERLQESVDTYARTFEKYNSLNKEYLALKDK